VLMAQCTSGLVTGVHNTHQGVAFHRSGGNPASTGLSAHATSTAAVAAPPNDLKAELDAEGLGLCHGILHASGVRRLTDIQALTKSQITDMGVDSFDRRNLFRVMDDLHSISLPPPQQELSTLVYGAFERKTPEGLEEEPQKQDFLLQVVCAEHDIFQGRLFTEEQCRQISRMAEYHAYRGISTIGAGWTNELYTLTAQHMQCKDVPGLLSTTSHIFDQLRQELYSLFPGRIRKGSIDFESSGEPHLVKYHGKAKGTEMHTDSPKFVCITLNVVLSADDDFSGGGTYIEAIDKTIHLKQGEVLIHLGDLEHAGADITGGVRNLLIGFLECEWENEALNKAKP
jgi:hypothetical protein